MKTAVRMLRWLGAALALLIVVLLGGFGLLQTRAGQDWLARTIQRTISEPDFTVAVTGLGRILRAASQIFLNRTAQK
jgi:autotransporter translocation and assembly factor TamB